MSGDALHEAQKLAVRQHCGITAAAAVAQQALAQLAEGNHDRFVRLLGLMVFHVEDARRLDNLMREKGVEVED